MEQVREALLVGGVYSGYVLPPVHENADLIFVKFPASGLDYGYTSGCNHRVFAREEWADAIACGYEPYERDEVDVRYVIFNSTTLHDLLAAAEAA